MATIQKTPAGTWRASVCVKGQRATATRPTKREAERWAAATETELHERALLKPAALYTLADACNRYANEIAPTHRGERWEIARLSAWLKDSAFPANMRIGDILPEHLAAWRDARAKVVTAGSILRDFKLLASVFEAARRDWRWIETNPVRDVRKPRSPDHRDVTISRPQIKAMLLAMCYRPGRPVRSVSQAVAVCFLLALRTGMRAGELTGLTWDRVFDYYVALPVTKTRPRDVPIARKSARLLEKMRGYDPVSVFGLGSQTLDANFRKYRQRAGLSGFTFHDSRHTAATWLARKVDVLDLCKVMGWSNTSQALTYYNPHASDIARRI